MTTDNKFINYVNPCELCKDGGSNVKGYYNGKCKEPTVIT